MNTNTEYKPENLVTLLKTTEFWDIMKNTEHGTEDRLNPFHMEGSVLTHTLMVFREAVNRYPHDKVLHIATLLHDIGKCFVREEVYDEKKGFTKVTFYNHEGVSAYYSIDLLNTLFAESLSEQEKIDVINTISLHGDFFDSFHTEKGLNKLIEKFKGNTYLFEQVRKHLICDHLGRICLDEHNSDELITLDPQFVTNLATKAQEYNLCFYTETQKPNLVLFVGPPCSGKSTEYNKNYTNYTKISRDDILMEYGKEIFPDKNYSELFKALSDEDHKNVDKRVQQKFQTAVNNNQNIVIDMTNMSAKGRRKWLGDNKVRKSYNTKCVVFYTGLSVLQERNMHRNAQEGKFIPNGVFHNMIKNFSTPLYDEVDEVTYILN